MKDATGNTLYNHVVEFFNNNEIPYKENMIGFAADSASAMSGEHHSLSSLLKKASYVIHNEVYLSFLCLLYFIFMFEITSVNRRP